MPPFTMMMSTDPTTLHCALVSYVVFIMTLLFIHHAVHTGADGTKNKDDAAEEPLQDKEVIANIGVLISDKTQHEEDQHEEDDTASEISWKTQYSLDTAIKRRHDFYARASGGRCQNNEHHLLMARW